MAGLQRALSLIYPSQCLLCRNLVEQGGLCRDCWPDVPFLKGLVCDTCGTSLPGTGAEVGLLCDDCLATSRPWEAGRAALSYRDAGRRIVLALKHGDRTDLARPAAGWMAEAGREFLQADTLIVPIPIHWSRLLRRRYNQSAELARALGADSGCEVVPDGLVRTRRTLVQDGMTVEQREDNLRGAFAVNPRKPGNFAARRVCIVDDVMTSGATLAEAARCVRAGGAAQIFVLVLARVEKTP